MFCINSCWIKSDDGAIAAFIVPIMAIILVCVVLTLIMCSTNDLYLGQVNFVFLLITLKVLWVAQHKKSVRENVAPNQDTAKYVYKHACNCYKLLLLCRRLLKAMMILLPLLGLTWIIGILAVNNDTQVFAWIFAILNTLQVCMNVCVCKYITYVTRFGLDAHSKHVHFLPPIHSFMQSEMLGNLASYRIESYPLKDYR